MARCLLFLCALLYFQLVLCQIGESCKTVDGDIGSCVSIEFCTPFLLMMQREPINQDIVALLTAAHCGFDGNNPKVCCPEFTPETSSTENPTSPLITTFDQAPRRLDLQSSFLTPPICGVSNTSSGRVVGGVNAKLGDLPWMCLLGYMDRGRNENGVDGLTSWRCGGSLVSPHHVLTAAHCIHNHEKDLYVVRLGELDLDREDEAAPIDLLIIRKIKHQKYDVNTHSNDIGLLVLERDVDFTDLIMPICLPSLPNLLTNTFVDYSPIVAGWGRTSFRGFSSSHLKMTQLQVVDNRKCKKTYSEYPAIIDESVICAEEGGRDACEGDSGGPLIQPFYNQEQKVHYFYQIGVVSYGIGCAESGYPGVYTRVTHYIPWIQRHIIEN